MPHVAPVTVIKEDEAGRQKMAYGGEIVRHDEDVVVARCPWSLGTVLDLGGVLLEPGDVFYEYYYPRRWFNVFRIVDAGERLKGWYCNVICPPRIQVVDAGWEIRWRDLALDLLILPDSRDRLLDEDEFEAISPSDEVRARAAEAVATLRAWAAEGREPFGEGVRAEG